MAQAAETFPLAQDYPLAKTGLGSLRSYGWMPLLALPVAAICLIYLVTTSSVLGTGYDIQRLERERDEWQAHNEQLEFELAKIRSLVWVESQATGRLGMVKPEHVTYVYLDGMAARQPDGERATMSSRRPALSSLRP